MNGKPLVDAESLALRALALALCGEAPQADGTGLAALEASREEFVPTVRADTICAPGARLDARRALEPGLPARRSGRPTS